jgi:lipoprotein-anchoring transpeptidase ErfK/SrfK
VRALIKATTAACAAVVVLSTLAACSSGESSKSPVSTSAIGSAAWTTKSHHTERAATSRRLDGSTRAPEGSPSPPGSGPSHASPSVPVAPARKPRNFCAHNAAAQKVIVSISKQHAWMCAHHRDVFTTPVTTGMVGQWTHTPTGHYMIQGRNMNTVLTLNTGATYDVKYWIPFDAPLFGFHDASWQHFPFGSPKYKTNGSHGCVHMPLKAMKFLYNWSARPTAVHIS